MFICEIECSSILNAVLMIAEMSKVDFYLICFFFCTSEKKKTCRLFCHAKCILNKFMLYWKTSQVLQLNINNHFEPLWCFEFFVTILQIIYITFYFKQLCFVFNMHHMLMDGFAVFWEKIHWFIFLILQFKCIHSLALMS